MYAICTPLRCKLKSSFQVKARPAEGISALPGSVAMSKLTGASAGEESETVNVASRIQHESLSGRVLVSATTYKRIHDVFNLEEHGTVELKGHGPMRTYWLVSQRAKGLQTFERT